MKITFFTKRQNKNETQNAWTIENVLQDAHMIEIAKQNARKVLDQH